MAKFTLVRLGPDNIDRIMDVGRRAFATALQARRETVLRRFALGHFILGAEKEDRLVSTIAFSYIRFAPEARADFPRTFKAYSTQPTPRDYNTVVIYSLGIEPDSRELACIRLLIHAVLEAARKAGCTHAVADGMIPSFAGDERTRPNPEVRALIEAYAQTARFPAQEEFLKDPALALFHLLTGCQFLWLLPDFLPADTASGGWRVLLYRNLSSGDLVVRRRKRQRTILLAPDTTP
jgi:hypothetical protein